MTDNRRRYYIEIYPLCAVGLTARNFEEEKKETLYEKRGRREDEYGRTKR